MRNLKISIFTLWLGLATVLHVPQVIAQEGECTAPPEEEDAGTIDPPKIDEVTKSVNMLMGLPVHEQRRLLLGKQMFTLTRSADRVETELSAPDYNMFEELGALSLSENCVVKQTSSSSYWGMGESSLESQSSSTSTGFDASADIGVSVMGVSASTTMNSALVFGNSDSSSVTKSMSSGGQTRASYNLAQRDLYSVKVEYDKVASWTQSFINQGLSPLSQAIDEMQRNTSFPFPDVDEVALEISDMLYNEDWSLSDDLRDVYDLVLEFFRSYGTHGLTRAYFGQMCLSSLYMQDGFETEQYDSVVTESNTNHKAYKWWGSDSSTTDTDSSHEEELSGMHYSIANKQCIGNLALGSICESLPGTGKDVPEILRWSLLPIWKMPIDTKMLSNSAREWMVLTYAYIMALAEKCSKRNCSYHGACSPNLDQWLSSEPFDHEDFFLGNQCFCRDEFDGTTCDHDSFCTPAQVKIASPQATQSSNYNIPECGYGTADKAFDDDTNGIMRDCSVTHTGGGEWPWWEIKLDKDYWIEEIKVWNREDSNAHRLAWFTLEIILDGEVKWMYLYSNPDISLGEMVTIPVGGVVGRTVRISKHEEDMPEGVPDGDKKILSLAEVKVFGCPSPKKSNVALYKPTSQSSTWLSSGVPLDSSLAVDGDYDNMAHTKETNGGEYWEVSLLGSYLIDAVVIHDRNDNDTWSEGRLRKLILTIYRDEKEVFRWDSVEELPNSYEGLLDSPVHTVEIPKIVGDRVRIKQYEDYKEHLNLAEVEVYGLPF